MSDKMFYLLMAGVATTVGIGIYFMWNSDTVTPEEIQKKPEIEIKIPTTIDPSATKARIISAEPPQLLSWPEQESTLIDQEIKKVPLAVQEIPSCTFIVLSVGKEFTFDHLEDALEILRQKDPATLKIVFEKSKLSSVDEKKFRQWLARVGDYIFARRLVLIKNTGEVIRNAIFARAKAAEIEQRGNILLSGDGEKWEITIRGLGNYIDEIRVVAQDIILKALSSPQSIKRPPPFEGTTISKRLNDYTLTEDQGKMADALIRKITWDASFQQFAIKSNLLAFLPLYDFRHVPNISEIQKSQLENLYGKYYQEFYEEIIVNNIGESKVSPENLDIILGKTSSWLEESLVEWVSQADISTIIKNSLFI